MAVTTTELVAEVRSASDLQNSRFRTDPQILGYVNECLSDLYDTLVMTREGYFQTSVDLTLDADDNEANLPSGFYKELGLTCGSGDSKREILPLESFNDRNRCSDERYWIGSRVLTVYPQNVHPPSPVTLTYVPNCPVLTDGAAIPVDMERFREHIVVAAAIKIKTDRQQDAGNLIRRLERLDERVKNAVTGRKAGPKKVPMPAREQARSGYWQYSSRRYWP